MTEKRNIQNTAPLLADDFLDLEESIFDHDKYSELLEEKSDKLGNFKKYLIGKLHDSWIINLEIQSEKLKISLNDFSIHVFADAIVEKFNLGIEHDKLVFPMHLEQSGKLKVEFYRVKENGDLECINPISVDEYLGEQVIKLTDEHKEIAYELWHSNENEDLPGERILMIVSSTNLKLTEDQDKAWIKIFGNVYDDFYQYFKYQFESGRYVSGYSECLKLVDEYEKIKREK
jgi:hypothetical protein